MFEWMRLITPLISGATLFIASAMMHKINTIDERLFHHLTNEEIHIPRGQIANKDETDTRCLFLEKNYENVLGQMVELRADNRADHIRIMEAIDAQMSSMRKK